MSDLFHAELDKRLREGYDLWAEFIQDSIPAEYRYIGADAALSGYDGRHAMDLAAACQCFFWFRYLHERQTDAELLLGDYFFSSFSHWLIPIDSTPLIDAFSAYLKDDTEDALHCRPFNTDDISKFFAQVGIVLDD